MASRGPEPVEITLTEAERAQLEQWARRRKTAQAQRSRIVLAAAAGENNTHIAERVGIGRQVVAKWRGRFAKQRCDGLLDEPRPGRPRTISDAKVEEVIVKTLESKPKDATHWSTRSMAREAGLSQTAVARIWRAFGLQPHRSESFKLSTDPLFVEKVRDGGAWSPAFGAPPGSGRFSRPPKGTHLGGVDRGPLPVELTGGVELCQEHFVQLLPDALPLPLIQSPPAGDPGATAHLLGEVLPGDGGLQDEEDAGQGLAVADPLGTGVAVAAPHLRDQRLHHLPELVGNQR
jgi:transposase